MDWRTLVALTVGAAIVLVLTAGCARPALPSVRAQGTASLYDVKVAHEDFKETNMPGDWKAEREVVEIKVPASAKETTMYLRPKQRTVLERVFPSRAQTTVEAVASAQDVKVTQGSETPWWWWAVGAAAAVAAFWAGLKWLAAPLTGFATGAWALVSRLWKK